MTHPTDTATLSRWMAGDFCNREQAFDNPPFFAHIRVCMRPLPARFLEGPCLFLEQAYEMALDQPYRLRILELLPSDDRILLRNYTVANEEKFRGAARNLDQLAQLAPEDLVAMPGCDMWVDWTGSSFKGRIQPGKGCKVTWKGQDTYLDNEIDVSNGSFLSLDRGRHLETDERVWGSIAGPFQFIQRVSFADEVAL